VIALAGYGAIVAGLGFAVALVVRGLQAARRGGEVRASLRVPALGLLGAAVLAMVLLEAALLLDDFTIEYVAGNHARATPLVFTIASGWAALEGSIVLWGLVLAGFVAAVWRRLGDGDGLGAGAMAVMGLVAVFFFGLMATVGNPFRVCTEVVGSVCTASSWHPFAAAVAPVDGAGANPLLQNHILMAVHPPMLYLGYVGFTVPFAFAVSALARAERGSAWLDRTHRWSIVAWSFLTLGIVLGGWWSYEVLGWGGYWAWDPVENAALLPWLAGTAFLHSAVVQRRRGMLQAWNLALVISTFALTILGTFLTRSGVIASVHSFTQSPVGPAILGFLVVVTVGSLALFAFRAHLVASSPRLESLASREGAFLANNLLLTLFAFAVLLGTLYPLIVEAFSGDQVSVGRPFFDRAAVPISLVLLLAVGVGPVTPYRVARGAVVWRRIRGPLQAALVAGAVAVLAGVRSTGVVLVTVLAGFVVAGVVRTFAVRVGAVARSGVPAPAAAARVLRSEPGYWGGQISHLGLALLALGIAASSVLAARQEITLAPGASANFEGYTLTYTAPFARNEPTRRVEGARIELARGDRVIEVLEPRLHVYDNALQPVATPSVHTGIVEDVYLSLAGLSPAGVVLDAYRFPLMWVLWTGGLVMVLGGAWATVGRRWPPQREVTVPPAGPGRSEPAPVAAPGGEGGA
jgi:cytochrome c-type biogenesis protein CcmF